MTSAAWGRHLFEISHRAVRRAQVDEALRGPAGVTGGRRALQRCVFAPHRRDLGQAGHHVAQVGHPEFPIRIGDDRRLYAAVITRLRGPPACARLGKQSKPDRRSRRAHGAEQPGPSAVGPSAHAGGGVQGDARRSNGARCVNSSLAPSFADAPFRREPQPRARRRHELDRSGPARRPVRRGHLPYTARGHGRGPPSQSRRFPGPGAWGRRICGAWRSCFEERGAVQALASLGPGGTHRVRASGSAGLWNSRAADPRFHQRLQTAARRWSSLA